MTEDLAALEPYATGRQKEYLSALLKHGGNRNAAARELGIAESSIRRSIERLRRLAAKKDPEQHRLTAPEGFQLRGVSTLQNAEGQIIQRWVKTEKGKADPMQVLQVIRDALEDAPLTALSVPSVPPAGELALDDILSVYPMGDPHFGMLAWGEEAGEDFDLQIAERTLCAAVDQLVGLMPASRRAMIVNVGDFFHADNNLARTARGANPLDVDSRWMKVLRIGVRALVRCVDRALLKHEFVRMVNAIGNHDEHTALMLSIVLDAYYRNEPRVEIDISPARYHYHQFGEVLLGVTHGHGAKMADLPLLMATDRPNEWGETKFRYWLTGHIHHEQRREYPGCIVESYRTLAAKDAWHAGEGYRSGRSMVADVYHRSRGRIMRHEVGIEQLTDAMP